MGPPGRRRRRESGLAPGPGDSGDDVWPSLPVSKMCVPPEVQIDLPWTWDLLQDPDRSWIDPIQILGFQSGSDLDLLYCFLEK